MFLFSFTLISCFEGEQILLILEVCCFPRPKKKKAECTYLPTTLPTYLPVLPILLYSTLLYSRVIWLIIISCMCSILGTYLRSIHFFCPSLHCFAPFGLWDPLTHFSSLLFLPFPLSDRILSPTCSGWILQGSGSGYWRQAKRERTIKPDKFGDFFAFVQQLWESTLRTSFLYPWTASNRSPAARCSLSECATKIEPGP